MTVVGGQDDRAAGPARLVEDGAQVADLIRGPVGRALLSLVQGVIDRVEHDGDHGVGAGDRVADRTGQGLAGAGSEAGLVEERGLAPAPEAGLRRLLLRLVSGREPVLATV